MGFQERWNKWNLVFVLGKESRYLRIPMLQQVRDISILYSVILYKVNIYKWETENTSWYK